MTDINREMSSWEKEKIKPNSCCCCCSSCWRETKRFCNVCPLQPLWGCSHLPLCYCPVLFQGWASVVEKLIPTWTVNVVPWATSKKWKHTNKNNCNFCYWKKNYKGVFHQLGMPSAELLMTTFTRQSESLFPASALFPIGPYQYLFLAHKFFRRQNEAT